MYYISRYVYVYSVFLRWDIDICTQMKYMFIRYNASIVGELIQSIDVTN